MKDATDWSLWIKPISKKVQNGFDFLGVRFNRRDIIGLAKQLILNFISRIAALYEQGASDQRIGQCVRRWCVGPSTEKYDMR